MITIVPKRGCKNNAAKWKCKIINGNTGFDDFSFVRIQLLVEIHCSTVFRAFGNGLDREQRYIQSSVDEYKLII